MGLENRKRKKIRKVDKEEKRSNDKSHQLPQGVKQGSVSKRTSKSIRQPRDFVSDLKSYLQAWKLRDSHDWKFNKVLQTWALQNCFEKHKIDSKLFKELLPYIMSIQGAAMERLMVISTYINFKDSIRLTIQ